MSNPYDQVTVAVGCSVCGWESRTYKQRRGMIWWLNRLYDLHYIRHALAAGRGDDGGSSP